MHFVYLWCPALLESITLFLALLRCIVWFVAEGIVLRVI